MPFLGAVNMLLLVYVPESMQKYEKSMHAKTILYIQIPTTEIACTL